MKGSLASLPGISKCGPGENISQRRRYSVFVIDYRSCHSCHTDKNASRSGFKHCEDQDLNVKLAFASTTERRWSIPLTRVFFHQVGDSLMLLKSKAKNSTICLCLDQAGCVYTQRRVYTRNINLVQFGDIFPLLPLKSVSILLGFCRTKDAAKTQNLVHSMEFRLMPFLHGRIGDGCILRGYFRVLSKHFCASSREIKKLPRIDGFECSDGFPHKLYELFHRP